MKKWRDARESPDLPVCLFSRRMKAGRIERMAYLITEGCTGCDGCTFVCPAHAITGKRRAPHRVDPAACIDCGACGRICPAGAVRVPSGEAAQRLPRAEWLLPFLLADGCTGCGACIEACPSGALVWQKKAPKYPALLRTSRCIGCGFCAAACPEQTLEMRLPQQV